LPHEAFRKPTRARRLSAVDHAQTCPPGTEKGWVALKPALEAGALIAAALLAVNNEDRNEIELADLRSRKASGTIALTGCDESSGIAYDPVSGLALSACSNGKAALVNMKSRHLVSLLPIGQRPDTVLFDPKRHLFLVPCGQGGELNLFRVSMTGKVSPLSAVKTETGARTAALDPVSGRVFLPAARFQPAEAGAKPAVEPGSFHLLVMTPQ